MPYICVKRGSKWELEKKDGSKKLGTHDSKKSCNRQMRAVYFREAQAEDNIRIEGFVVVPYNLENKIEKSGDIINVVINSSGGSPVDAIIIHNKLRNSGKRVHVYVEAFAQSAAAIVMLAGDEIYIAENGLIVFHPPQITSYESKGAEDLEKIVDALKKMEGQLVNTLMSKTKKSEAECQAIIGKETWLTPNEALELGIVNEIIPILRDVEVEDYFPSRIVNFVKGKQQMPLKEICDQFGIQTSMEDAEDKLVQFINQLKIEKKEEKKPMEVSGTIINMIKKSRTSELDALVATGKVIPKVANDLKVKFLLDDRIKTDIQTENTEFDNIVNCLSNNEPVISFKEKAGAQRLPKDDQQENPMVRDAKRRAEAAKR